jgi:hypothetical protein
LPTPCGAGASCTFAFNTRLCLCTTGMTSMVNNSLRGSRFNVSGTDSAPGCPYGIKIIFYLNIKFNFISNLYFDEMI